MFSLNEISSTLKKAALGSGFDVGRAEVIADAGCWLIKHRRDGAGVVLKAIEAGPVKIAFDARSNRFEDAHLASCGLAAIDLLLAGKSSKILFSHFDHVEMLVGFAGRACDRFEFDFVVTQNRLPTLEVSVDGVTMAATSAHDDNIENSIRIVERVQNRVENPLNKQASAFNIDQTTWNSLLELAHKTYVPASEASRKSGAGAGLVDND